MTFRSDVQGQVIRRDESDNQSGGDPHEIWYRFGGRQIGYVGNNGSLDIDYAATDVERSYTAGAGAFENGATTSTPYADFDQAVAHINSFYQGSRAGSYTAQAGETFSSIAATLWGDGSLWYKLAQANGASSDDALTAGEIINIPTGVMRSTNTATTFIPYDPADITGNTSPTAVKPPKNPNNHCGVLGQILLVVVAVAVAAITKNFLIAKSILAKGTVALAATAAAAGSVVSQAVGVATGIQDKFSWNQVALAAIGGGVGASGIGDKFAKTIGVVGGAGQAAVAGAFNNGLTQGIGMAVGAQKSFSWAGVAAAGIGAAAFDVASNRLPGAAHLIKVNGVVTDKVGATFGNQFGATMASTLANAGARSLIEGSDFGDNIIAALPDVIGQIIGQSFGDAIWDSIQGPGPIVAPKIQTAEMLPTSYASDIQLAAVQEVHIPQLNRPAQMAAQSFDVRRLEAELFMWDRNTASQTLFAGGAPTNDPGWALLSPAARELLRDVGQGGTRPPVALAPEGTLLFDIVVGGLPIGLMTATAIGGTYVAARMGAGQYEHYASGRSITLLGTPYDSPLGYNMGPAGPIPSAGTPQLGFGVEIRNQDEADLIGSMMSQGADSNQINTALSALRNGSTVSEQRLLQARLDFNHILDGDVTLFNGQTPTAGGGHYLGSDSVWVTQMLYPADAFGVTKGTIHVRDSATGGWVAKRAETTFFPESWSRSEIQHQVEGAFLNSAPVPNTRLWQGISPSGVVMQGGYAVSNGRGATAWPVHQRDQRN